MLGALIIYLKCAIFTLMFYGVFKLIMVVSSPNQVLSSSGISGISHNAWWYNLIILFGCLGYIFLLGNNIIKFTWVHRRDMGLEASLNSLGNIATGITGGFSSVSDAIGNYFGSFSASSSGTGSIGESEITTVSTLDESYNYNRVTTEDRRKANTSENDFLDDSSSAMSSKEQKIAGWGSSDIDKSIERGEEKNSSDKEESVE